jgi:hypothetical protein
MRFADVTLAPRNVNRKVEGNATFMLSKPDNIRKASGAMPDA